MHLVFLTPDPAPPGSGSAFNAGLVPALRAMGHQVTHASGTLPGMPLPDMPPGAVPVIDGMVLPALEARLDALLRHDPVVVVHHVSAAAGRDDDARDGVRAAEARMLPRIRRVAATSAPVAARLAAEFGVPSPVLLPPGMPELPRNPPSAECRILSAGVLTPRKGHDRLLRALARLADLEWSLTIAGDAERDAAHARTVTALVDELNLAGRVAVLPNPSPDAEEAAWRSATLFTSATRWEGWPGAAAVALRRGIPVVASAVGGLPALVPPAAGILCPPDDPATWGKCLRRAIFDTSLRAALAEGAWQAGCVLPGWPDQAAAFDAILRN